MDSLATLEKQLANLTAEEADLRQRQTAALTDLTQRPDDETIVMRLATADARLRALPLRRQKLQADLDVARQREREARIDALRDEAGKLADTADHYRADELDALRTYLDRANARRQAHGELDAVLTEIGRLSGELPPKGNDDLGDFENACIDSLATIRELRTDPRPAFTLNEALIPTNLLDALNGKRAQLIALLTEYGALGVARDHVKGLRVRLQGAITRLKATQDSAVAVFAMEAERLDGARQKVRGQAESMGAKSVIDTVTSGGEA